MEEHLKDSKGQVQPNRKPDHISGPDQTSPKSNPQQSCMKSNTRTPLLHSMARICYHGPRTSQPVTEL